MLQRTFVFGIYFLFRVDLGIFVWICGLPEDQITLYGTFLYIPPDQIS